MCHALPRAQHPSRALLLLAMDSATSDGKRWSLRVGALDFDTMRSPLAGRRPAPPVFRYAFDLLELDAKSAPHRRTGCQISEVTRASGR